MKKKWLAVGIILLFMGTCINPANAQDTEKPPPASRGNWLYVGGSGPGNYTKIQDAINDSSDGGTVFVFNGTYYENLVIDTPNTLTGEDKNSTIIDGSCIGHVVNISVSNVQMSGFTIQNSGNSTKDAGIKINSYSNFTIISDNIIQNDNGNGIIMQYSTDNLISNNIIKSSEMFGLDMYRCNNNSIIGNYIRSDQGIMLIDSSNNLFYENVIEYCYIGFELCDALYNNVSWNLFTNNSFGVLLSQSQFNTISSNNFMYNSIHACFSASFINTKNKWAGNYWNKARIFPKLIFGVRQNILFGTKIIHFPWFQFDWHPAQKPYDIGI
jgi:parallel beta-helix repeat protein